ncbi:MAG: ECF transporter S component [Mycoplasma sp.]|nr:ECF transporter S component [Mycoplasma sp.]
MLPLTDVSAQPLLTETQVSIFFVCFIGLVFLVSLAKKIYYRVRWHRRYYIVPRIRIKGITNVAMTISMSISIILLLTFVTSGLLGVVFRGYPGVRVLIEGILIQLGGLLFGPFIGLLIGGITDLLTIALTAGMFHPGFFIISLAYGIVAGLFKTASIAFKNNNFKFSVFGSITLILITALLIIYIYIQQYPNFKVQLFSHDFIFTKAALSITLTSTLGIVLIVVWLISIILNTTNTKLSMLKIKYNILWDSHNHWYFKQIKKYGTRAAVKQARWYAKHYLKMNEAKKAITFLENQVINIKNKNSWIDYFLQTTFLVFSVSAITNVFLVPYFDVTYSTFEFDYWLAIRTLSYPIISIVNLAVIFPIYKVVNGLVKYDYSDDRIENISKQYLE